MIFALRESPVSFPKGVMVAAVRRPSPAWAAGIRAGDRVLSVGGQAVCDELDFSFHTAQPEVSVEFLRRGRRRTARVVRCNGELSGVELRPPPVRRCVNRCVFCFIDQMPPGLRKSLYVKDEDIRHSFLNGNYVTLASARRADLDRIIRLRLSPVYVSVHATVRPVRNAMLGNARAPDVMAQLRLLVRAGIRIHAQIVVCPGYNDGAVLRRTIRDLLGLGECVESVAIVPVGVTRHRRIPLRTVDASLAAAICREAARIGEADARCRGRRRVFAADELYIKAGLPVPPRRCYGGFPQIENGVGLVRQLLDQWASLRRRKRQAVSAGESLVVTGVSAAPYLRAIAGRLAGPRAKVLAVQNRFFGETVTVAGLLTAQDVVAAVRKHAAGRMRVVLPAAMFNFRGITLDGWSLERIERRLGRRVRVAGTVEELAAALGVNGRQARAGGGGGVR